MRSRVAIPRASRCSPGSHSRDLVQAFINSVTGFGGSPGRFLCLKGDDSLPASLPGDDGSNPTNPLTEAGATKAGAMRIFRAEIAFPRSARDFTPRNDIVGVVNARAKPVATSKD